MPVTWEALRHSVLVCGLTSFETSYQRSVEPMFVLCSNVFETSYQRSGEPMFVLRGNIF